MELKKTKRRFRIPRIVKFGLYGIIFLLTTSCITTAIIIHRKLQNGGYLEEWKEGDGTVLNGIVYNSDKDLKYDLYLPIEPTEQPTGAMLFIHGGSWNMGSRQDMVYLCRRYVKCGYVTATLDYSLVKEKSNVTFFTMLDEIGECLAHLAQTAAAQGHPVKSVALSGMSAGGHLAMLYAYSRASSSPIPIAFVFQTVGPSFFMPEAWPNQPDLAFSLTMAGTGEIMTKGMYESDIGQGWVKSISPAMLVNRNTVPTLFAYGGKDSLVNSIHGEKLKEAFEANGVPYKYILFPNSGHALWDDPDCTTEFQKAILQYAEQYFGPQTP